MSEPTALQALVAGALMGCMMKGPEHGLLVDVEPEFDGNQPPLSMVVTGRESGEQVRITVEEVA